MKLSFLAPAVLVPLAATVTLSHPHLARAQSFQTTPATYEVTTTSFANGEYGTIRLYPGYGFTLDFSQTGQVVQRAWLDDMSAIGIDFSNGTAETIEAQFVHLKLIPEVNFQEVLRSHDGGTLLTLIAYDPATYRQHRYQFRIFPAQGVPTHTALSIQPAAALATVPASMATTFSVNGLVNARPEHVQMGLGSFMGELSPDEMLQASDVANRVSEAIALMHNGTEATAAAAQVGVSMQVMNYFAMRGLQASPANPLGLIDDVPPLELQGFSDGAVPGQAAPPPPSPPPVESAEPPVVPQQLDPTEPLLPPSADDLQSQSPAAPKLGVEYRARVDGYRAELDRLPDPVELDVEQRRTVNRIKIGSDLYASQNNTDFTYQHRVVALLAYLESGKSLPEASQLAEFDDTQTGEMMALAERALETVSW